MKNIFKLFFLSFLSVINCEEVSSANTYYSTFSQKNYMIVASQILRSRNPFGIAVHVFDDTSFSYKFLNHSFLFQAVILANNNEIVSHRQTLYWNYPQLVYFPTPMVLSPASYKLRVTGVSSNEITIFDESSELIYHEAFVCVSFQTTRPIYRSGQTVRFRILVLETTLLPFNDVMDVFILDPDNFAIKRWLSVYTNNGVASLHFKLPKLTKDGLWKIRSKINNQINEKHFIVHTYYQPYFEVIVECLPYTNRDEDKITALVYGIFSSQKFIRANASISWFVRKYSNSSEFIFIHSDAIFVKEEKKTISLSMHRLEAFFGDNSDIEVKIVANLTEFMSGEMVSGFSHTRIATRNTFIKFLSRSPMIFTPENVFSGYVAVFFEDHEHIPREFLAKSTVKIQITTDASFSNGKFTSEIEFKGSADEDVDTSTNFYDKLIKKTIRERFLETSIIPFSFDIPPATTRVELKAIFLTFDGRRIEDKMPVVKKYLPEGKYIKVWTSSENLSIGDDAVFHVKMNFEVETFYTLIVAKGIVLMLEEHKLSSSPFSSITFSKLASPEMAPLFHLIIYCFFEKNGSILSDTVSVPVNGFSRYETTLEINTGKDFRAQMVEAVASGAEGAFIGVQAVRSMVYHLQGGQEVTITEITDNFLSTFEKNYKSISKVTWLSRTGEKAKISHYFPSHDYAIDTNHTFSLNNVVLMTNMKVPQSERHRECHTFNKFLPCFTDECFAPAALCDGSFDCFDGTDESNCPSKSESQEAYFLNRINWHSFIFDETEGDWAFFEFRKNDHEGVEFQFLNTPTTADNWYLSAINMDMKFGFSTIAAPVVFSSHKPLMAHVLGPTQCHRGEQLGLKIYVHNCDTNQMLVTITLLNSQHYKFVQVGENGIVASYTAKLIAGDIQKLIYMAPESQVEIHFPVAPSLEQGTVRINFEISSQAGRKLLSHTVEVLGEGALINRHTSVAVDLKNRGLSLQYLDIIVEETPIVPYEIWRRYVFGSPAANITISNDVIGPVEKNGFLTMDSVLKRESKGAMDILFEIYVNIWTLHYLRFTNQLNWNILKETLTNCNTLYGEIMRYFHKEGWFGYWETSTDGRPSVWLTAWALRVLNDINFPDWEFHIWIDPSIFISMVKWLLKYQNKNGFFSETPFYDEYHFDARIQPNDGEPAKIILTAHVLISLHSSSETVDGELKTNTSVSCYNARTALEKALPTLKDPYAIAMIAYAFSIVSSSEAGVAFDILRKHTRMNEEGLFYWSRLSISANPVKLENQRRYVRPRVYENAISSAVEATSWALLTYLAREGVSPFVEKVVQWLISVRMTNNGFISISDTAVAYRALSEFSLRSRILDTTSIDVKIEMMASTMTKHNIHVSNISATVHRFKIPYVWGHVDVVAQGSGLAFIQMDVNYGIDDEQLLDKPPTNSFYLKISEFYSTFRNKSTITIESCLKCVPSLSRRSGAVMLEVQIPTGYTLRESDAIHLLKADVHPTLSDVKILEGKTVWFFDYLTEELNCFNHTIKRWYPVANLTLNRYALLYEITSRENFFQVLINSTQLYTLSICEVCGSYECPYCPHYNAAAHPQSIFTTLFFLLQLLINKFIHSSF